MRRSYPTLIALLLALATQSCKQSQVITKQESAATPVAKAPEPVLVHPKQSAAELVIPDTPAGKALSAWLDAFNSADEARLQTFVATYKGDMPAPVLLAFRQNTGGFDLISIEKSDRAEIEFVVKEKQSPTTAVGWLKLKSADPPEIATLRVVAIPPGLTAAQMTMNVDAALRARVIDATIAKLNELYIFPETAKKMEEALREFQRKAAYDAITDARAFATLLTEQLRAVSHDKHLRVEFEPTALPEGDLKPTDEDNARVKEQMKRTNCGFRKSERLDGNVGYIKFDFFGDVEICGPMATAALDALGDVDALIFDLRTNGGGEPEMVAFVLSRLFEKRTHLNDIYERKGNQTTEYWTKPEVPGKKFPTQPVFVLTSKNTFSGAEEFTYNLKNLKRATIIGETTGGGAHPTMGARLDEHFMISVPSARAINPITKTNWEGTGVEPDVKVAADQALDTAKKLAAERLAQPKKQRTK
jgi:hypothetical protein